MDRILKSVLLSSLIFTALHASQKEREGGPYIGLGYGFSSYNDDGYYSKVDDRNIASYNLYAGAYINKYLSVELDYMRSGDFKVEDTSKDSFNYSSVTINALAHYPVLYGNLDFYAKFGAGQSYVNISGSDGAALVIGGGMSYRINEIFALKVGYDMYSFNYDSDARGGFDMDVQYAFAAVEVQF